MITTLEELDEGKNMGEDIIFKNQVKLFRELKTHCDLARSIPVKFWKILGISNVPQIKEYPGLREDIPFLGFVEGISKIEATQGNLVCRLEHAIVDRHHYCLIPSEQVIIQVNKYKFRADHRSNAFAGRYYIEIFCAFNEILGKIFDPLYEQGYKTYVTSQIKGLEDELRK